LRQNPHNLSVLLFAVQALPLIGAIGGAVVDYRIH
jgi:hypothetical protein